MLTLFFTKVEALEYENHKEAECYRGYHISNLAHGPRGFFDPLALNGLLKNFWTGEFFLKVDFLIL